MNFSRQNFSWHRGHIHHGTKFILGSKEIFRGLNNFNKNKIKFSNFLKSVIKGNDLKL